MLDACHIMLSVKIKIKKSFLIRQPDDHLLSADVIHGGAQVVVLTSELGTIFLGSLFVLFF